MLYSYFIIALRSLFKSKVYTVINVSGLGLGIAGVFLIILYLRHELSYDRFHENAQSIYRVIWAGDNPQTRTPHPMVQALKNDFPEVLNAVSLTPLYTAGLTPETHSFRNPESDTRYDERTILAVDTTFFEVFSFPLLKGNPETALKQVDGVLISESMARKYFGDDDPLGQHLAVDSEDELLEVTGVFEDVPVNAHFHFDFLISYLREKSFDPHDPFYSWSDFGHYNYIVLKDGADPKELEGKLMEWLRKYIHLSDEEYGSLLSQQYGFRLQPLTDIHLKSKLRWELEPNGNIEYVYILAAAALLTLVIACVNFMNLSTAKSVERAKEIGVRKTLGALPHHLSFQFLAESVTLATAAMALAILIVEVSLPFFNFLTGLSFDIRYTRDGLIFLMLGILIGIVAGIYPSLYLSKVRPHLILKGKRTTSPGGSAFRRGLIVFQFFISMMLISSALIINQQLRFLSSKNLGFEKEAMLVIPVKNESGMDRFKALQTELLSIPGVASVSASSNIPGKQFNQHAIAPLEFPDYEVAASEVFVDFDFFHTLDIPVVEGRTFLRDNPSDSTAAYVLNESAARRLNLKGPVTGKEILWKRREDNSSHRGTVIGIVKDFHFQSLHEPIRPLLFALTHSKFNHILVKVNPGKIQSVIPAIEKRYMKFEQVYGFEFSFLEDQLDAQYASEERIATILGIFTVLAIFIAAFGLFGMSLLTFQQKVRELSVRKVLGASLPDILVLLVGDFTKLILVAVFLATPFAWFVMLNWLGNFSYRIDVPVFAFILSGLALLLVAWLTLSYFTLRALQLNPAETLKAE